eukprot:XP_017946109.1 PREDICTED: serine/arginine repetitive matrix protein 4 [Xenopus tropicalis]
MASVQQGEKQLFEKFWKGTFKAVATPRRESVIVASITARKPLTSNDTSSYIPCPEKENKFEEQNGSLASYGGKERFGRQHTPQRAHSHSEDLSVSPPPKAKKKKKKSERKKRKRSRSYSPSPVKKKKKKSSKKRKRNRSSSKKRRHG